MIAYTMIGTTDLPRSIGFYGGLFTIMGLDECWRDDKTVAWGSLSDEKAARFIIGYPFDGGPANVGNGSMTAFLIEDVKLIDRLHALALAAGGSDEGKPGLRPQYGAGFYAAYVRDPDGNKLAFVCYHADQD